MLNQNGGIIGPANIPTTSIARGVWSLKEAFLAQKQGIWPVPNYADPYFEYTTLLLPGNGTNGAQNNTFLDSGTANGGVGFTITRNGNTTQGTFSPFSQTGWGNYFDGTGDYLTVADNTALQMTGDFTWEGWIYYPSNPSAGNYKTLWAQRANTAGQGGPAVVLDSAGNCLLFIANATATNWAVVNFDTGLDVTLNQWQHFALVKNGTTVTLYKNGVAGTSTTHSTAVGTSGSLSIMAGAADGSQAVDGFMSNFRIVKGVAVYTGNFTPPTSPLAATQSAGTNISAITGTQTSLLTCQSNRFIDNSTNNFTITRNGDTRVVAFSPFNPTASWSAATYGGSGYFDGSGDYLRAGSAADWTFLSNTTAAWTVEFWIYNTTSGSATVLFDTSNATTANVGVAIQKTSSEYVQVYITYGSAGNYIVNGTSTSTLTANTWNHVFISYNQSLASSNLVFYINGVAAGTANKTANTPSSSNPFGALSIGTYGAGSGIFFTGYLSNVRISNVVRTPPSSVPTSPYTSDTDTKLLLNFTNAGIYDATSKNDLETVGNAQISNTTAKFGSTSMYFDGTGDWLTSVNNPAFNLGSGDFTVELWLYITTNQSANTIVSNRSGGSGTNTMWTLQFYGATNRIDWHTGTAIVLSASSTISTTTWTHVAVSRASGTIKMFFNGTQVATASDTRDYSYNGPTQVGYEAYGTAGYLNGYIQDLRITKGYARYTANFTAPTAAFPTL